MQKKYEIKGMSCGGCVNNVKRILQEYPGVKNADVHLKPPGALLTMDKEVIETELQAHLAKGGHYTIKETV